MIKCIVEICHGIFLQYRHTEIVYCNEKYKESDIICQAIAQMEFGRNELLNWQARIIKETRNKRKI